MAPSARICSLQLAKSGRRAALPLLSRQAPETHTYLCKYLCRQVGWREALRGIPWTAPGCGIEPALGNATSPSARTWESSHPSASPGGERTSIYRVRHVTARWMYNRYLKEWYLGYPPNPVPLVGSVVPSHPKPERIWLIAKRPSQAPEGRSPCGGQTRYRMWFTDALHCNIGPRPGTCSLLCCRRHLSYRPPSWPDESRYVGVRAAPLHPQLQLTYHFPMRPRRVGPRPETAEEDGRAGNHDISNRHTRRFGKYTSRFEQDLPSRGPVRIRVPTLACGSLPMDPRRRGEEAGLGDHAGDTHPRRSSSSLDSVRGVMA